MYCFGFVILEIFSIVICSIVFPVFLASCNTRRSPTFSLNYDELIPIDAENLAELGIKKEYDSLKPKLKEYISKPANVIK